MAKKVLIVDDSSTVRQQLSIALGQAGFATIEAVNGVDALSKINDNKDVAMVVCDVNMPQMGGIEFLETMKREGKYPTLPILMLTTEGQPALMDQAKKAGAKGWMVKPFKPDLLVATANKLTKSTP